MPTIGGAVVHNARRVPNRVALVADNQRWTWAELDGMVAGAAARLRAARLCAGDRFAMVTANTAAGVIAYFAAARLGAIIVPVNARLAAPEMYQFLLHQPALENYDTSSWRVGIFGGAPMPAHIIEQLLVAFPGVQFFQQCGQTEACPTGIYSTAEQIRSRPHSSGHLAQPFVEARVVDSAGVAVRPGGVGELVLHGELMMKEYWDQPAATAETIRQALVKGN
jgi:acyl-CoA synthetase (AMP-forming)/AMP-acid ligase II